MLSSKARSRSKGEYIIALVKILGATLLAFLVAVAGVGCGDSSSEQKETRRSPSAWSSSPEATAATRGATWLISHAENLPQGFPATTLFRRLYRVWPEGQEADIFRQLATGATGQKARQESPLRLEQPLGWDALFPWIQELRYRRCAGGDIERERESFQQYLVQHERRIVSDLHLSRHLVAAHFFEELGLVLETSYEELRNTVLDRAKRGIDRAFQNQEFHGTDAFAVVHILLTRSNYFSDPLDPKSFSVETQYLKAILRLLLSRPFNDVGADLAAEVGMGLKLLGEQEDPLVQTLMHRLRTRQNEDGSWGKDSRPSSAKVHHTVSSVLALLPYTSSFRKLSICGK